MKQLFIKNKKGQNWGWIVIILLIVVIFFIVLVMSKYYYESQRPTNTKAPNNTIQDPWYNTSTNTSYLVANPDLLNRTADNYTIESYDMIQGYMKVANWNLQIFGTKKADNETLMNFYANKIKRYDVIFIQEIRDDTGLAFQKLCKMLPEYNCMASYRAGNSVSKEQYGIISKKNIFVEEFNDEFIIQYKDNFNRPPIQVILNNNNRIAFWNIHTDPDSVKEEMTELEKLINNTNEFTIILGDLNADCSYYNNKFETHFNDWYWVIDDFKDTTVAATDCAYDRIITNNKTRIIDYGIDKNITKEYSDHYLVWVGLIS